MSDVFFPLFLLCNAAQQGGRRHNAHLWMFGANGVKIFTPDGATEVKTIAPEKVCKETTNDDGSIRVRCDFSDVVSDGRKVSMAFLLFMFMCHHKSNSLPS